MGTRLPSGIFSADPDINDYRKAGKKPGYENHGMECSVVQIFLLPPADFMALVGIIHKKNSEPDRTIGDSTTRW